ncbi:MAG TPA: hypothetical protein VFX70_11160, partial [Mycobacteriales bacterium]|nr:hypothetical protein [Mycobacteriales bacterium]
GARQRATAAAHVLTVRMGLTRPGHLRSLAQEIGAVLGYGWSIGVVLGVGASVLVGPLLDLDPAFPPPALLRIPLDLLVGTVVGVLAATVVGVLTAHRTAARQSAAAVLTLDT